MQECGFVHFTHRILTHEVHTKCMSISQYPWQMAIISLHEYDLARQLIVTEATHGRWHLPIIFDSWMLHSVASWRSESGFVRK